LVNARHLPVLALPPSAAPALSVAVSADIEALVRDCQGPLDLDLSRLVLPHRVENVPPPPEFVFRPFVPSRPLPASPPSAVPLEPLRCRVIDERQATTRVERRWRVDVAPCLRIESPRVVVPSVAEQPSRRRRRVSAQGGSRSVALPNLMDLSRAISELEAAFAERPFAAPPLAEAARGVL
jgi:hypothetical protein